MVDSSLCRDTVLILGLERSPGEGMATHSSILAWRIPWTEKPGRLQSVELQESDTTERLTHITDMLLLLLLSHFSRV